MKTTISLVLGLVLVLATGSGRLILGRVLYSEGRDKARNVAFGLVGLTFQMVVATGFIWLCITLSTHLFDSAILRVIATAIFFVLGAFFVLPFVMIAVTPLMLLVSLPLEWIFPSQDSVDAKSIAWCKNCRHYKKSKEYESPLGGLWNSRVQPPLDKLPCEIRSETVAVWDGHFSLEPRIRTLFPNDCPFFERRNG